jgi:hypothetical protein
MPEMKNFRTMEEVREDREEYCMHRADVDVHVSFFLSFILLVFLFFRLYFVCFIYFSPFSL